MTRAFLSRLRSSIWLPPAVLLALATCVLGWAPAGAVELKAGGELRFNIGSFRPWTLYDAREDDSEFLLHRTRAHVGAELTDRVKGLVEVQAFGDFGRNDSDLGIWWPDRRDDHDADEDLWLYQGYVAAEELLGSPVSVTLGKQELVYGNEFLLGNNDSGDMFFGHSFDAVKVRGAWSGLALDLFLARLNDSRFLLDVGEDVTAAHHKVEDANATLVGAYGAWSPATRRLGLEALEGYLLSIQIADFNEALAGQVAGLPGPLAAAFPGHVNMDGRHAWLGTWGGWAPAGRWDANPTGWWRRRNTAALGAGALALAGGDTLAADASLQTAGLRAAGLLIGNRLDYDIEVAKQFGPTGRPDFDDSTRSSGRYEGWAIDLEVGHELRALPGSPRLSGAYVRFSGGPGPNARDESGALRPDNDVETFQRLWSDKQVGENLDRAPFGVFLSNVEILGVGADIDLSDRANLSLDLYRYTVDEPLDPNGPVFGANPEAGDAAGAPDPTVGERARRPDEDLGAEIDLLATYFLTDDLRSTLGYAVFLNGDTLRDQAPSQFDADENQHYVFLDVKLTF